jgi:hypothetical protein
MKRLLSLLISFALVCACASAQTLNEYLKLRRQYKISQAVGVEALETLVGSRVVEVSGVVKGTIQIASGATCLLLEKSDGNTMFVSCPATRPDWLSGNAVPARIIVNAHREKASEDIRAVFVGAASESEIAQLETVPVRRNILTSRHAMRAMTRVASSKDFSLPVSEATPLYASFVKRRNPRLSDGEASRIAQGVVGYSLRYGVDARLIMAMVMVESGFNPNARSRTGAMGLGQLMPGTAAGMGVSNAYDSIDNLYGTVRLIRNHLENYQRQTGEEYSSLVLALAAYNAGPGAVSRHGGVPPYRETQNYVRKVIGIYRALCGA